MFHPTIKVFRDKRTSLRRKLNIVVIGAGGNAGPFIQKLARSIYAYNEMNTEEDIFYNPIRTRNTLMISDGDTVEEKNLLRQLFIEEDIGMHKAEVLAERYSEAYGIPIFRNNNYIETEDDISSLFNSLEQFSDSSRDDFKVLIGCVDNNATRQIMHRYFKKQRNIIYLDAGITGVEGATDEELFESGYSGQVVCGLRSDGVDILESVCEVFPNIYEDKDSRTPLQACGRTVVNHPQRLQTNETASLILHSYMNNLLFDDSILTHYTNFNAQTMTSRPVYITEEAVEKFKKDKY